MAHKGKELDYLVSGQLEMTVESKSYKVNPGDTIYLQKDIPGGWRNLRKQAHRAGFSMCHVKNLNLKLFFENCLS